MTRIEVKDFGSIAEGAVDLKPLTVFIGPNNSGKSYMALLVYALSRVGAGSNVAGLLEKLGDRRAGLDRLRRFPWKFKRPDEISVEGPSVSRLRDELRRCFGASIEELVRRDGEDGPEAFSLAAPFNVEEVDLQWEVRSREGELEQAEWGEGFDSVLSKVSQGEATDEDSKSLLDMVLGEMVLEDVGRSHYLPASRTGILLVYRVVASVIVGQASLAWVRPTETPMLTGDITDLMQYILLLEPSRKPRGDIKAVVDFIEREITRGKVDVDQSAEYPEIFFEDATGRYRLNQVSSTVSEIAPLVLFLKYVVEPGERVIIEEPESHLDAGNQRHLASAIAKMVNAGVNVLVTTHSNFLLSEVNNLLLASGVEPDYTEDYDANELLAPEQVGAYLFSPGDEGTHVEEIEVTKEDGISVDSFARVHEALYDEAIRLQYAGT